MHKAFKPSQSKIYCICIFKRRRRNREWKHGSFFFFFFLIPVLLARAHFVQRKATFEYYSKEIFYIYLFIFVCCCCCCLSRPILKRIEGRKYFKKTEEPNRNCQLCSVISFSPCHKLSDHIYLYQEFLILIVNFFCISLVVFLGSGLFILLYWKNISVYLNRERLEVCWRWNWYCIKFNMEECL